MTSRCCWGCYATRQLWRTAARPGDALDVALWDSPAAAGQQAALARYRRLDTVPFDHERRLVSVLAEDDHGRPDDHHQGRPGGTAQAVHRHSRCRPHGAGGGVRRPATG